MKTTMISDDRSNKKQYEVEFSVETCVYMLEISYQRIQSHLETYRGQGPHRYTDFHFIVSLFGVNIVFSFYFFRSLGSRSANERADERMSFPLHTIAHNSRECCLFDLAMHSLSK